MREYIIVCKKIHLRVIILETVCDDACKEVVMDPADELLVCTISGRCFDSLLSPAEAEFDAVRYLSPLTCIIFNFKICMNACEISGYAYVVLPVVFVMCDYPYFSP